MNRKLFNLMGALYVAFALITAHVALAPPETTLTQRADNPPTVGTLGQAVWDNSRLDFSDSTTARSVKSKYEIKVWTSSWCSACRTYKAKEVPALLKFGYTVKVLDYQTDNPPPEVKMLPTVQLVFGSKVLKTEVYWKAKDLDKYVESLLKLKK